MLESIIFIKDCSQFPNLARFLYTYPNMKVSIPVWNHRVSPVFDTARRLLVFTDTGEDQIKQVEYLVEGLDFFHRVECLIRIEVDVLICGAISKPLEDEIVSRGIQVISQVCGNVNEVFEAYCSKRIFTDYFLMPGCCKKRRIRNRFRKKKGKDPLRENRY